MAIGTFDGVHAGHREVISRTLAAARTQGLESAVLTFDPHPRCVIDPPNCPLSLTVLEEKLALLGALGLDHAIVYPFTPDLRLVTAEDFVTGLLDHLGMRHLVAGADFALGRRRQGDVEWLRADGQGRGYGVEVVEPITAGGSELHSSDIRRLITAGDVEAAARMLGRPYSICGPVEHGEKVGRTLGWPTANVGIPERKLVPGHGVYAGWARGDFGVRPAATNVGYRITFGGSRLTVEAYLLDFEGDLYGRELEVTFVHRLRDEVRYEGARALADQIGRDVEETRRRLGA